MQPLGIMFHHLHGRGHVRGQGSISAGDLREMIRHVGPDRILPAQQWLERSIEGALDVDDLCLTFDDNLRCQYDLALPVLREFGLTAFWFIPTATFSGRADRLEVYRTFRCKYFRDVEDFYEVFFRLLVTTDCAYAVAAALADFQPDAYLSTYPFYSESDRRFRFVRDEVLGPQRYHRLMDALMAYFDADPQALARGVWMDRNCIRHLHEDGHVIGMHTHSHPTRLVELSVDAQFREYHECYMAIRRTIGQPPTTVSHPCNSYGETTLTILRQMGVMLGFRSNTAQTEFCELEYPREDHANVLWEMQTCGSPFSPATNPAIAH